MQRQDPEWVIWPVSWSAVWVGALTALALGLLIGLVGFALGANEAAQYVDWKKLHLIGLVFSVIGAFFGYVGGGWVAARIAGRVRSEPAILHGAIVWLLTIPMLLILASLGSVGHMGGWYGGLSAIPALTAEAPADPNAAIALRNNSLATAVALLIGLIGAVLGAWMASGEPMTFTHYRTRDRVVPGV
jgi:hypothetical protein